MPVNLLDELARLLEEISKDYCPVNKSGSNKLIILPGYLKPSEEKDEALYPYIMPQIIKGDDSIDGSTVALRLYFGIYSDDLRDGWRELFNLTELVRQLLLKRRTIAGRFRLEMPLHWEAFEVQSYPVWKSFIDLKYTIGQPIEELEY